MLQSNTKGIFEQILANVYIKTRGVTILSSIQVVLVGKMKLIPARGGILKASENDTRETLVIRGVGEVLIAASHLRW